MQKQILIVEDNMLNREILKEIRPHAPAVSRCAARMSAPPRS